MKTIHNTKIIGIDHGYGNMKTANCCFPTGIAAYDHEPLFTADMLVYGGRYYLIGEGHKEFAPDKIKAAVDDLNKTVKQASPLHHTQLSFKYHEDTNRISITVTDSDTDEVIREIPPEKTLDMLAKAWEMAGLLVDERR